MAQILDQMRAVIKYPGAKWNLADWIISHFPPHRSYLEPFFGSGAVLFSKSRSAIETINDRDNDVINLFEWIRKDPERLARAIYWTPYAREVYNRAWEAQYTETDSFQRAVDFYCINDQWNEAHSGWIQFICILIIFVVLFAVGIPLFIVIDKVFKVKD